MIKVTTNSAQAKEVLDRLQQALKAETVDRVIERVAFQTQAELMKATPKKWFGQVRGAWQTVRPSLGTRLVKNDNKVMLFLEEGTKDHGPKTKKFLYIPLTRAAAAGWNQNLKYGVDYILKRRVKGIRARHIIATERPKANERLKVAMMDHVRKAING